MERIAHLLDDHARVAFTELFQPGMHKSTLIGMFLAILELVRHHGMHAEQSDAFGEIWLARELPNQATEKPAS
jgi:segregation and condensation protein A